MKLSHVTSSKIVGVALLAGLWALACSSDEGDTTATGGGTSTSTGGKSSTGTRTGGASSTKTGGASGVGGTSSTAAKTGGAPGTGGSAAVGGTGPSVGGTVAVGGTVGVGGTVSTSTTTHAGGTVAVGGTVSTGTGTHTGGIGTGGIPSTTGGHTGTGGTGDASVGGNTSDAAVTGMELFVPLSAADTSTLFQVDFGAPLDLSETIITANVCVDTTNTGGAIQLYATYKEGSSYLSTYSSWDAGKFDTFTGDGCHALTLDLAALAAAPDAGGAFDKSKVQWIGFNVADGATGTFTSVTVFVETLDFSNSVHANYTFDSTNTQGFAINPYQPVPGSKLNGVGL